MADHQHPISAKGFRFLVSNLGKLRTSIFLDKRFTSKDRTEITEAIDKIVEKVQPFVCD